MAYRVVNLYYDVQDRLLRDSEGSQLNSFYFPYINYKEKVLLNIRLVTDSSNTAYTSIAGTDTFTASVNNLFGDSANLLCKTLDANVNKAGDWAGGTADPTLGQVSVRLDAENTNYSDKFVSAGATTEELTNSKFELKIYDAGGNLVSALRFPYYVFNLQDDDGETPPAPISNYYTKAQNDAQDLQRVFDTQTTLTDDAVTNIALGTVADYRRWKVEGIIDDGTNYNTIVFNVSHNGTLVYVGTEQDADSGALLAETEMTIAGQINGVNAELNITLASLGNNLTFVYEIHAIVAISV